LEIIKRTAVCLDAETEALLYRHAGEISEIRLRINRPLQLSLLNGKRLWGKAISAGILQKVLNQLMENSLYACEHELKQGYFSAGMGCRVGVCGKISEGAAGIENMANVGSICIRIPREIPGCGDEVFKRIFKNKVHGFLIISAPGKGKTTLLRELIRRVSDAGYNVAVADERREIAGCSHGIPAMDLGKCADVLDGFTKAKAISMLLRACAPEMIAVDEIGTAEDAEAILDAARCGTKTAATVHASCVEEAFERKSINKLLASGVFEYCIELGPEIGKIRRILEWNEGEYRNAEGNFAFDCTSGLHGHRSNAFS